MNGVFYNKLWNTPATWEYMFIIQNGKIHMAPYKNPLNNNIPWDYGHADLANMENIDFAWEFIFKNWIVTSFSNQSGHFLPGTKNRKLLINLLKPKYSLDDNLFNNAD